MGSNLDARIPGNSPAVNPVAKVTIKEIPIHCIGITKGPSRYLATKKPVTNPKNTPKTVPIKHNIIDS